MIVFGVLCGIGVLAAGFAAIDLVGKRNPRRQVDSRAIDIGEAISSTEWAGEYFPPPDDGRPQK
jgi:hypothetical protein